MGYNAPNYGGYARSKADTQYKYSNDSINNAYGRFISQQRGERNLGDMYRGYERATPSFKSGLASRGLGAGGMTSGGAQRQAMDRFVGDFSRDYGRAQQDLTQTLQQFDLNQANLDSWREQQIAAIEAQKQTDIAKEAAQLQWLKQMVGGL